MQTTIVKWIGAEEFSATMSSGQTITFDGDRNTNAGASPMDMLLAALGACTSIDVVMILAKKRQHVVSLEVSVSGRRATGFPAVWTEIEMIYKLTGNLDGKAVRDAVELSQTKYCSVAAMLRKTAEITYRLEILPA